MGYESLVLPCEKWKLQFDHNDNETRVSIVDTDGIYKYVILTRTQAQELKRHLNSVLPHDFDHDNH